MKQSLALYLDSIVFIFGAVVGSFLNVCVHRMPRDESIVNPPSHCPGCDKRIEWRDNIPLFSFLWLRGRCRYCSFKISPRYFVVELLTALLFLAVRLKLGWVWITPIYWLLIAGLIASTFIDFEHYIIPNEITYGGALLGLSLGTLYPPLLNANSFVGGFTNSLVGILAGGGSLLLIAVVGEMIFKKEAMGMGDVKFLGAIGAFLGWKATLFVVFASSVIGGITGLVLVLGSKKGWSSRIPYGPYIAMATLVWIFAGPELINWYMNFLRG